MNDGLAGLPRTRDRLLQGVTDGLHIGAQLYVSLGGAVIADGAVGEARLGVPMRPDAVLRWLSAGKPVMAVAIMQLVEHRGVDLDRPVAEYVAEFAQNGKEAVTLRHVLTHTGGFRAGEQATLLPTWAERLAAVCAAPLEDGWIPGKKAGYHANSGWIVLGELVRRITGSSYDEYVRDSVFTPMGMTDTWAMTTRSLVERYGDLWGVLHSTVDGKREEHPWFSIAASVDVLRPGSTLCGPAHDLGRFYETLLRGGGGVVSGESASAITTPQRVGMFDETFKNVMDWGLGTIIDSKRYGPGVPYGYGQHASERTFGHGGSQSTTAFADPAHELVVAAIFNGLPGEARHDRRLKRVTAAIYEDLGLASG